MCKIYVFFLDYGMKKGDCRQMCNSFLMLKKNIYKVLLFIFLNTSGKQFYYQKFFIAYFAGVNTKNNSGLNPYTDSNTYGRKGGFCWETFERNQ